MIIYGTGVKHLKAARLNAVFCPNCGVKGSVVMHVYSQYAHIFWIPLFSLGKRGISECQHCKQILKVDEMPADLKEAYNQLKSKAKIPVWHFIGLVLIGIFLAWNALAGQPNFQGNRSKMPQKGDVYEVRLDGHHTLFKIHEVTEDSVFVLLNAYEVSTKKELDDINQAEYYEQGPIGFSRSEIQYMWGILLLQERGQ